MITISVNDLVELTQSQKGLCASLYLPTHRYFPGTDQDPIRLKNLIRQAEHYLVEAGVGPAKCAELLGPARSLVDDGLFWRYQSDGLAIFIGEKRIRHYRVPLRFPELAVVTNRFYLKPLLASLARDRRFFVLALSLNHSRLFEASLESMAEITPDDFPGGLSAIVQQYELEKHLQFRTGTGARAIGHTAIFHGQGSRSDDLKTRVVEYLREIDRRVIRELAGKRSPLVLVGVDYLLATYRTINTYSHLFDADISGSPEAWSRQKLLQKSRTISELLFKAACREASDRYRALANTDRASNDVSKIVGAAYNGRVASLFVPLEVSAGGKFESESETVEIHQRAGADVEDLLDQSAVLTFLTGGEVFAVDPGDVPGDGTLAAVFRY